jgi:phosphatidylglycerophosphatase A
LNRAQERLAILIATWFGCGYFPWGPGTVGSIAAAALAWLGSEIGLGRGALICATLLLLAPGIWAAGATARHVGRKDPGIVVVDEVLGMWLTLWVAPALNWKTVGLGLALFRLFDIWKPWPVRKLEQLPGGVGIVADDLAAGIYAAIILYIGTRFWLL